MLAKFTLFRNMHDSDHDEPMSFENFDNFSDNIDSFQENMNVDSKSRAI